MNSCSFAGRVGNVKQLSRMSNGDAVLNFSVAVNQGKDKDGEELAPLWVAVTLWKEQAEKLADYIRKGDPIAVNGQIAVRVFEVDGETRNELQLKFARVILLCNKKSSKKSDDECPI